MSKTPIGPVVKKLVRSSMKVKIDLKDSENVKKRLNEIKKHLDELHKRMGNTQVLLTAASIVYYNATMERFRSHTDPKGRSWKHLKPRTVADKKRLGVAEPYSQLIRYRKLMDSIRIRQDGPRSIKITTRVPYASAHQFGAPKRGIPARKFFGRNNAADRRIKLLMMAFAQGHKL